MEPNRIEEESFRIITEEISAMGRSVPERFAPIIKRVIHTTADFSYLDNLGYDIVKQKHYKTNQHLFVKKRGNV